ncbi:gastrula zinc finger protein XlCGF46.1-like [Cydia amplana]|uniref:gastrula zinc finger protein XlCGF46.1-like n=1 Tax=Cydia amplana TaxID=1869771 RepID=UPI002FE5AE05
MNTCRTCLKTPADTDISKLKRSIKDDNRKCIDIIAFCLDIKVTEDSKITTKLCNKCYRKIISFYKFKVLSLKNDAYLRSLQPSEQSVDQKRSIYVDGNGIKHENPLEIDEYGPSIVEEYNTEIKIEIDFKHERTLGDEVDTENADTPGHEEIDVKDEHNEKKGDEKLVKIVKRGRQKVSSYKKRGHPKKLSLVKAERTKPEKRICEECGKTVVNLTQHLLQHRPKDERKMLQCQACSKVFSSRSGRNKHYAVAHLGHKMKCDICHKEVSSVKTHKMQVHNRHELPFGCVFCSKRFISRSGLEAHVAGHTKHFTYECDECHKRFRSKMSISTHIRMVHIKEKLYQCHLCSKAFFKKYSLQKHVWSHTKERPFECEECGKSFGDRTTLKNHRLTHVDVKSFRCEICDMSFVRKGYLSAHMISHTKEKRYPCAFCGARFGRSDHRNRHEFTAHKKFVNASND